MALAYTACVHLSKLRRFSTCSRHIFRSSLLAGASKLLDSKHFGLLPEPVESGTTGPLIPRIQTYYNVGGHSTGPRWTQCFSFVDRLRGAVHDIHLQLRREC